MLSVHYVRTFSSHSRNQLFKNWRYACGAPVTYARHRREHMSSWRPNVASLKQLASDFYRLPTAPVPALLLGAAGLVPFIAPPFLWLDSQWYLHAQVVYGATILSFLGGVRWGAALWPGSGPPADWRNMSAAVAPSLLAWIALLLPYHSLAVLTVAGGLTATACSDIGQLGYPGWFRALRACLSAVAVLSLLVSLVCAPEQLEDSVPSENVNDDNKN